VWGEWVGRFGRMYILTCITGVIWSLKQKTDRSNWELDGISLTEWKVVLHKEHILDLVSTSIKEGRKSFSGSNKEPHFNVVSNKEFPLYADSIELIRSGITYLVIVKL
jgi:hypothetical protein